MKTLETLAPEIAQLQELSKAQFGKHMIYSRGDHFGRPAWQHHLMNLVVADNPAAYLEEHS